MVPSGRPSSGYRHLCIVVVVSVDVNVEVEVVEWVVVEVVECVVD
jgi:hypothetical protein